MTTAVAEAAEEAVEAAADEDKDKKKRYSNVLCFLF